MKIFKKAISEHHYQSVQKPIEDLPFDNIFGEDNLRVVIPLASENMYRIVSYLEDGETNSGTAYKVDKNKKIAYKIIEKDGEPVLDRRPMRLGKVIRKELGQEWMDIWSNEASSEDSQGKSIILSRSPVDVVRMSDHSAWTSCHAPHNSYFNDALDEAQDGGAIAYVVKNNDLQKFLEEEGREALQQKEIFKDPERNVKGVSPISRLRVNRYVSDDANEEIAIPTTNSYGNDISGFKDTLTTWLREKQSEDINYRHLNFNEYQRTGGAYADRSDQDIIKNFFGEDMGVKHDLPHKSGQRRMDVWQDELESIAERTNERLEYSSVRAIVDAIDGMIYISAYGSVRFSFRGYIDEDLTQEQEMALYNIENATSSNELSNMRITEYCGYIEQLNYSNNNGVVTIDMDCIMDYDSIIQDPDQFDNLATEYEEYEEEHYYFDAQILYQDLIRHNVLHSNDSIADPEEYINEHKKMDSTQMSIDNNYLTFEFSNVNYVANLGQMYSSWRIGTRADFSNQIKSTFMRSIEKNIPKYISQNKEVNQTYLPFYNPQEINEQAIMDVSKIIPRHDIKFMDYGSGSIMIDIPSTELYRLGKDYVNAFIGAYDEIYRDIEQAIQNFCNQHQIKQEAGHNWYALCKIGKLTKTQLLC